MLITGPKISSWAIVMSSFTSVNTVGSTKYPLAWAAARLDGASDQQLRPLLLPGLDVPPHPVLLLLAHLRALLGVRVERVAQPPPLRLLRHLVDELVVHLLLDEQPAAGHAALPLVEEQAEVRPL